jgi:hypothetical protein
VCTSRFAVERPMIAPRSQSVIEEKSVKIAPRRLPVILRIIDAHGNLICSCKSISNRDRVCDERIVGSCRKELIDSGSYDSPDDNFISTTASVIGLTPMSFSSTFLKRAISMFLSKLVRIHPQFIRVGASRKNESFRYNFTRHSSLVSLQARSIPKRSQI